MFENSGCSKILDTHCHAIMHMCDLVKSWTEPNVNIKSQNIVLFFFLNFIFLLIIYLLLCGGVIVCLDASHINVNKKMFLIYAHIPYLLMSYKNTALISTCLHSQYTYLNAFIQTAAQKSHQYKNKKQIFAMNYPAGRDSEIFMLAVMGVQFIFFLYTYRRMSCLCWFSRALQHTAMN